MNERKNAWFYIEHQYKEDLLSLSPESANNKLKSSMRTIIDGAECDFRKAGKEAVFYNSNILPEFLNNEDVEIQDLSKKILTSAYEYASATIINTKNYETESGKDELYNVVDFITGPIFEYSQDNADKNWLKGTSFVINPTSLSVKLLLIGQLNSKKNPEVCAGFTFMAMNSLLESQDTTTYSTTKRHLIHKYEEFMLSQKTPLGLRLEMAELYPDALSNIKENNSSDIYSMAITTLNDIVSDPLASNSQKFEAKLMSDEFRNVSTLRYII